jgi:sulfofructose kinase
VDAETGERTILHQDARFPSGSDLPNPRIDADVLLVDAYHTDLALAGARAARARGIPVVSDVLPRGERAKLLAETDVAIAPEELLELAGTPGDALAACAYLRGLGPRTAVVTLGERGYVWQDPQGCGQGDAFPLEVVVDTTGAGDVFHGAFAFALVQGRSTAACCRFAAAASALNCAAAGGRGGIPTLAEVTSLVSERGW